MFEPAQPSTLPTSYAERIGAHFARARSMLASMGCEGQKYTGPAILLAEFLVEHPTARLVKIPHQSGQGYDQTKERRGKCNRIGGPTPGYQLWVDWSEPEERPAT